MRPEYKAVNHDTWTHIHNVRAMLAGVAMEFQRRALQHDLSKLKAPEVSIFAEYTPKLKGVTYGSPEYTQFLKEMKPALDNHYAMNSHHPEHYERGLASMTLFDLLEMLVDWKASGLRHDDGDPVKSIEINKDRFGMSDQLVKVLYNTLGLLEDRCSENLLTEEIDAAGFTVTALKIGPVVIEMPAYVAREMNEVASLEPYRVIKYIKPLVGTAVQEYKVVDDVAAVRLMSSWGMHDKGIGVAVNTDKMDHYWYRAPHSNFWMFIKYEPEQKG